MSKIHEIMLSADVFTTKQNVGWHMIWQIFDIFTHELSLFSTQLTILKAYKVNWVEKRLKSCTKMSQLWSILYSVDALFAILILRCLILNVISVFSPNPVPQCILLIWYSVSDLMNLGHYSILLKNWMNLDLAQSWSWISILSQRGQRDYHHRGGNAPQSSSSSRRPPHAHRRSRSRSPSRDHRRSRQRGQDDSSSRGQRSSASGPPNKRMRAGSPKDRYFSSKQNQAKTTRKSSYYKFLEIFSNLVSSMPLEQSSSWSSHTLTSSLMDIFESLSWSGNVSGGFVALCKTSVENVILQIFHIFTHDLSLFSTQLTSNDLISKP